MGKLSQGTNRNRIEDLIELVHSARPKTPISVLYSILQIGLVSSFKGIKFELLGPNRGEVENSIEFSNSVTRKNPIPIPCSTFLVP